MCKSVCVYVSMCLCVYVSMCMRVSAVLIIISMFILIILVSQGDRWLRCFTGEAGSGPNQDSEVQRPRNG